MSALIAEAIPDRKYLEELTTRMGTLCRFVEVQGESEGFRTEALAVADSMVTRALQLRKSLKARKVNTLSLDDLSATLAGMSLVSIIRDYDRALYELQNLIGDESHNHEAASHRPDVENRDALDRLEVDHLRLHDIMRELVA